MAPGEPHAAPLTAEPCQQRNKAHSTLESAHRASYVKNEWDECESQWQPWRSPALIPTKWM